MAKDEANDRTKDEQEGAVFQPEGVRRLGDLVGKLNDDERALLLALIGTDAETGKSFSDEERAAMDELMTRVEDYDATELERAVRQMVTSQSRGDRKLEWPELEKERRRRIPPEE
jgi:chitinase